jgi:hypothetical protein
MGNHVHDTVESVRRSAWPALQKILATYVPPERPDPIFIDGGGFGGVERLQSAWNRVRDFVQRGVVIHLYDRKGDLHVLMKSALPHKQREMIRKAWELEGEHADNVHFFAVKLDGKWLRAGDDRDVIIREHFAALAPLIENAPGYVDALPVLMAEYAGNSYDPADVEPGDRLKFLRALYALATQAIENQPVTR